MSREHCQKPTACRAKGATRHCSSCALKHKFTDPAFAAAHTKRSRENLKRLHADPAFKEILANRRRSVPARELKAALEALVDRVADDYKLDAVTGVNAREMVSARVLLKEMNR